MQRYGPQFEAIASRSIEGRVEEIAMAKSFGFLPVAAIDEGEAIDGKGDNTQGWLLLKSEAKQPRGVGIY
jgi:hypothetical protein